MDEDLDEMTRENLIDEVKKLRQGIRQHRDSSLHELCWHHPGLWGLLPEKTDPLPWYQNVALRWVRDLPTKRSSGRALPLLSANVRPHESPTTVEPALVSCVHPFEIEEARLK